MTFISTATDFNQDENEERNLNLNSVKPVLLI